MLARAVQALRGLPQVVQFIVVGGAAASTHLLTVALWVALAQVPPLLANVLAFFTSFGVSYCGHAWLTFADAQARHWRAALRYFLVASVSFAGNELLYALALRWLPWHYLASLLAVLLLVAVGTFVFSKFWAFRAAGPA